MLGWDAGCYEDEPLLLLLAFPSLFLGPIVYVLEKNIILIKSSKTQIKFKNNRDYQ